MLDVSKKEIQIAIKDSKDFNSFYNEYVIKTLYNDIENSYRKIHRQITKRSDYFIALKEIGGDMNGH